MTRSEANVYDSAASLLVAGSNLEGAIQQILDMGGGTWDRDTVIRALRAAFNNPERAVEYLYSVSVGVTFCIDHPFNNNLSIVFEQIHAIMQVYIIHVPSEIKK